MLEYELLSLFQNFLSKYYEEESIVIMDVTAGLYLVTADPTKPRFVVNINNNIEKTSYSTLTVEISAPANHDLLRTTLTDLNKINDLALQHWELCFASGDVIAEKNSLLTSPSLQLQYVDYQNIIRKHNLGIEEIKLGMVYHFVLLEDVMKDVQTTVIENAILLFIKDRPTRNVQSKTLLENIDELKGATKQELALVLKEMEKKGLLHRSGSWYFIDPKLRAKNFFK